MSTEYRRGIPSTAHVEAATRLGLLWHRRGRGAEHRTRFVVENGQVLSDYSEEGDPLLALGPVTNNERHYAYYCIRPDGTPVDWEMLDQEVVRVGQQGQPATVTPTTPTAPTTQQGFRADLWRRICELVVSTRMNTLADIAQIDEQGIESRGVHLFRWEAMGVYHDSSEALAILARWTVYQELKPLYDLVDGAQGEAAMPRDVYNECRARAGWTGEADDRWLLRYTSRLEAVGIGEVWHGDGRTSFERANMRNFAAVLDAVAERRVAERMREQTPANPDAVLTVTSAQPEPRRFADVRPDRHGWRWWLVRHALPLHQTWLRIDHNRPYDWSTVETVIPTDEQGNPVSWEAITPAGTVQSVNSDGTVTVRLNDDGSVSPAREGEAGAIRARWAAPEGFYMPVPSTSFSAAPSTPPRPGQFSNNPATSPLTPEGLLAAMPNYAVPGIHVTVGTGIKPIQTEAITTLPLPLPRFTTDELDDVDHSKTTKLDEVTLRRGKLPTVEQIAKYREVRARRAGGAVADALKESRIDCEVAQYVLERWAGGLGDAQVPWLIATAEGTGRLPDSYALSVIDERVQNELRKRDILDTSEKPSPTVQRERQEAEERRQRLAQLQQRLAAERAAQPQGMAKESDVVSRFDLIEPDPQADPAVSIRAWEARQAAAKVSPMAALARPAAAPRRPAIDVVDADVDGLSRSEAFAALFGRALNGGC